MASLTVMKDGTAVPATSNTPAVRYGFAVASRPAPINYRPASLIQFLQWQDEGVNLGDNAARVVNFTANPAAYTVTRGVGEHSNVITVQKVGACSPNLIAPSFFSVDGDVNGGAASPSFGVTTTVTFGSAGNITGVFVNSLGTYNALIGLNWYSPNNAGAGANHWIRFSLLDGDAPNVLGSAALGVWIPLSAAPFIALKSVSGQFFQGDFDFDISSDASGAVVCVSGAFIVSASAIAV